MALYFLVLSVLAVYGLHRLWMVLVFLRRRRREPPRPMDPAEWPRVTVQLPLYNEVYVAARLIDAVCRLDYPRDRLEIQVLDDSTDETTEVAARLIEQHRARGLDIQLHHRQDRTGFKAGALTAGLAVARGELIALFDADFVPEADFLRRAVPWFADPTLGMVQGRWHHINREYSLLTRIQAVLLDGHFMVEHIARNRSGCFFNFNGTAGIWRRAAIETAGGWEHDTLTEDLDLSYRAQLAGWRFLYLPDLAVPSELPVEINGFKSQQYRWAKGAVQTCRKLLGRVMRAPLPPRVKLEAFIHLTNSFSYPLMILLSLLNLPVMLLRHQTSVLGLLAIDVPLFLAATFSVALFYFVSQVALGQSWRRQLLLLPSLLALGIGLAVNNAFAVLSGLFRRGGTFERTPKYNIEKRGESWRGKRYRGKASSSFLVEVALTVYFTAALLFAAATGRWLALPFLALFVQGYGYMVFLALPPRLAGLRLPRESWQS